MWKRDWDPRNFFSPEYLAKNPPAELLPKVLSRKERSASLI